MFLPHYDVYRVSITEQTTAKCYLLVLCNKKVKSVCQNRLCSATKRLLHRAISRDHDLYKTKHNILAVDNSEMAVIGLSLKQRQRASVL